MNKHSKLIRIGVALTMLGLAILACGPTPAVVTSTAQPQATSEPTSNAPATANTNTNTTTSRADLIAATVQIFGVHIKSGKITPFYVGSGSIISSNGLILTNAHVAQPSAVGETDMDPDALVVGIIKSEDQPPVYSYRAEVRAIDGYVDLAVIQITSTVDGESLDPSSLHLPYVPLGNSDQVHVGDRISIFGFPAIGGNTITFTSGDVAGFTSEEQLGDRAWIKTDATISGGNSGGMAANEQGQLIGVPSIASSGAETEATDCRVIQDTNGDGVIDSKDTCIPIGGFINALRPVNLATPLIKAAQGGQVYTSPYSVEASQPAGQSTGSEQIGQISWFTVDSQGNLGDQVDSYPSGTTVLVAGFKFSGFVNGEPCTETWTLGGQTVSTNNSTWDQGSDGTYSTSLSNQGDPLPDGSYHLALFAGSSTDPLSQSDVAVGKGSSNPQPGKKTGGIQVSGTVTDKSTDNPIPDAYVIVLNPGVTYDDWAGANYPKEDIFTYAKTDSNGEYALTVKLSRNTSYTIVASAHGYYDAYGDNLEWSDQEPADFTMNISLGN